MLKTAIILALCCAPAPERKSKDGKPFPEVEVEPLNITVPIIRILGCKPEDFSQNIFHVSSERIQIIQKKGGLPNVGRNNGPWVVLGQSGANVAFLRLDDGCIVEAILYFNKRKKGKFEAYQRTLARSCGVRDHDEIKTWSGGSIIRKGSVNTYVSLRSSADYFVEETSWNSISFSIPEKTWYVATHDLSTDIKTAINKNKLAMGMTLREADLVLDYIGKRTVVNQSPEGTIYRWMSRAPEFKDIKGRTLRGGQITTVVDLTVRNGRVVDFTQLE